MVELRRVLAAPGNAVVISPPVYPPFFDWAPETGTRLVEAPLAHDDAGWRHHRRSLPDERLPDVRWDLSEATYLAWLDCGTLGTDGEAHRRFLRVGRVALEAGLRFGDAYGDQVRLNFATSEEILDEATDRMARAWGRAGSAARSTRVAPV